VHGEFGIIAFDGFSKILFPLQLVEEDGIPLVKNNDSRMVDDQCLEDGPGGLHALQGRVADAVRVVLAFMGAVKGH
jgi:hypothetical protein